MSCKQPSSPSLLNHFNMHIFSYQSKSFNKQTIRMQTPESQLILNQIEKDSSITLYSTINPQMSAKRTAPYAIDEKTLEPVQKAEKEEVSGDVNDRKILKVKSNDDAKPQGEKKEEGKGLLFVNIFKNNNGVGLFNNTGLLTSGPINPPDFKINLNANNLFNNTFSNNNLFKPTTPKESTSLFQNTGSSIFGFGNGTVLPPVRAGQEDDEGGDSAQLEKNQEMKLDKSKSTGHYEYKEEMKTLFNAHAKKYKKNDGDLIENVEIIVQIKEETKYARIVVRLPATKHSILIGTLVRGKCDVRVLNKKEENQELSVFVFQEGKQPIKEKVKLQFENGKVGKEFFDLITSLTTAEPTQEKKEERKQEANEEK